jgi:hypothetical protein
MGNLETNWKAGKKGNVIIPYSCPVRLPDLLCVCVGGGRGRTRILFSKVSTVRDRDKAQTAAYTDVKSLIFSTCPTLWIPSNPLVVLMS